MDPNKKLVVLSFFKKSHFPKKKKPAFWKLGFKLLF